MFLATSLQQNVKIMGYPQFPQEFLKHCPKVESAVRRGDEDPEVFAECAFNPCGLGLMCESCKLHLTRPYTVHEVDREFLPLIERYYREADEYEKQEKELSRCQGEGI